MIAEIQAGVAGLKTAAEITKVIYGARLDADTKEKVHQLKDLIFDARESLFAYQDKYAELQKTVATLEQTIADMNSWTQECKRYELFKPFEGGSVVYALKESASNGEPPHYLCTSCYQTSRKSILNTHADKERWTDLLCPVCKATVPTGFRGHPTFVYPTARL